MYGDWGLILARYMNAGEYRKSNARILIYTYLLSTSDRTQSSLLQFLLLLQ